MNFHIFVVLATILLCVANPTDESPNTCIKITLDPETLVPDLEILRAYWRANSDKNRIGRIKLFPNTEIVVKYSPDLIPDKDWESDFLSFETKCEVESYTVPKLKKLNRLLFKDGVFFYTQSLDSVPIPLPKDAGISFLLTDSSSTDTTPSIEIRYIDFQTLANDIKSKILILDSDSSAADGTEVTLSYGAGYEFKWTYYRDPKQIYVRHLRVFGVDYDPHNYRLGAFDDHAVIRYDREQGAFFPEHDGELTSDYYYMFSSEEYELSESSYIVRPSVYTVSSILKNGTPVISNH